MVRNFVEAPADPTFFTAMIPRVIYFRGARTLSGRRLFQEAACAPDEELAST